MIFEDFTMIEPLLADLNFALLPHLIFPYILLLFSLLVSLCIVFREFELDSHQV